MSTMNTTILTTTVTETTTSELRVEIEPFCPLKGIEHCPDNQNIVDLFAYQNTTYKTLNPLQYQEAARLLVLPNKEILFS